MIVRSYRSRRARPGTPHRCDVGLRQTVVYGAQLADQAGTDCIMSGVHRRILVIVIGVTVGRIW
jgi:hypothetical protein